MQLPERFTRTIIDLFPDRGPTWLAELPQLIAVYEQRWQFTAGQPVANLSYNYVAPAVLADGTPVILKAGVPSNDINAEVAALQHYAGRGICRLLQADPTHGMLLLERLQPGTMLADLPDDDAATRIAAEVMLKLWRPLPPNHNFPTVADWAKGFGRLRAEFEGGTGAFPRAIVEQAEHVFTELLASAGPDMLLHGDLHHDNILQAEREPWLAIDPKGLAGEPAYEVGALLRNPGDRVARASDPAALMARRVAILAETLGIPRQRIAGWGFAQSVLSAWWTYEDHHVYDAECMRYAEWLALLV